MERVTKTVHLSTQYDAFASEFSRLINVKNMINREAFYQQIDFPLNGKVVLDLACGDGSDMLYYQSKDAAVFGIDASKELVRIAKDKVPGADIRMGMMEELPYRDNSFDVVLSKYAIQTSADLAPIFKEVERVLMPGGIFMYLVTHPIRQFMEVGKQEVGNDYFEQKIVDTVLFEGQVTVKEPTHTFNEYFSSDFLAAFNVIGFEETCDLFSAELVEGSIYPGFFIVKARKRTKPIIKEKKR